MYPKGVKTGEDRCFCRTEEHNDNGRHGRGEGLCIRCAVASGEFRERAPYPDNPLQDVSEARAWISGRGFKLVLSGAGKSLCTGCGEEVFAIYSPEDQQAA
jgi:hypothetical protein